MSSELWSVRVKAFAYELLAVVVTGGVTYLSSTDFSNIVNTHFGGTIIGTLILLVVSAGIKHLRNVAIIGRVGSTEHTNLI